MKPIKKRGDILKYTTELFITIPFGLNICQKAIIIPAYKHVEPKTVKNAFKNFLCVLYPKQIIKVNLKLYLAVAKICKARK